MSAQEDDPTKVLGVVGITINAMALIAPGAFLWATFGLQAACSSASGESYAKDMWAGIILALIVAFSTAVPYAELARKYPEADCWGAYYFAKKGFEDTELGESVQKWQRTAKLLIGWSSHLFYWVYPAVMTAFQATLVGYIIQTISDSESFPTAVYPVLCAIMVTGVGFFCYLGVTGSTNIAIAINVIQLSMLVIFSCFNFHYRATNPHNIPDSEWSYENVGDVITPKSFTGVLFQASIAILILVGFDSATSLGGDAVNPRRDVPRGVFASLGIQGCIAYLFEYWAANAAMSNYMINVNDDDEILRGMDAAGNSDAPIGDLAIIVINGLFGSGGKTFMVILSLTVAIAVFGSTLAAMNTAVRFTQGMAEDGEMPEIFATLSSKGTPLYGILANMVWTFLVGSIGACGGVMTLTAVTLASNIGTFVLYGSVCVCTIVAFHGKEGSKPFLQLIMPIIGFTLNVVMVLSIFIIGLTSGGDTTTATIIAMVLSLVWIGVIVPYWITKQGTKVIEIEAKTVNVVPSNPQQNGNIKAGWA